MDAIGGASLLASSLVFMADSAPLRAQEAPPLVLGPDPVVVIGSIDGPEEAIFQFLIAAARLPDGRLLTADLTAGDIRIFDRDGRFITGFGGRGRGPAEFEYIQEMLILGDTVVVADPMQGKLARFTIDGTLRATERTRGDLVGFTEDGGSWWTRLEGSDAGPTRGVEADRIGVYFHPPEGDIERVGHITTRWRAGGSPYPLSPVTDPIVYRDSLLWADPIAGELLLMGRNGTLGRTIRVPIQPMVAGEAWEVLEEELRSRGEVEPIRRLDELPRIERLPRFAAVLTDDQDRLWVKKFEPAEDAHWLGGWAGGEGGEWLVLEASGQVLRTVEFSERVVPLQITGGFLLGRMRDEWDVQYLVVYRIPALE